MLNSNSKQEISRYDLKKQLEGIQSFDISSFADSKNQSYNIKGLIYNNNISLFPTIEAPTLSLLQDSQYNIRYLDPGKQTKAATHNKKNQEKKQTQQYYGDLTARHSQNQNTYQYEQKIQKITKQLEQAHEDLSNQRKHRILLQQKINMLEQYHAKTIAELKQKNKEQKEQIKALKERQIKNARQKQFLEKQLNQQSFKNPSSRDSRVASLAGTKSNHTNSLLTVSSVDDISNFCPELLSPEQTVTLLSKLLKKVSKSSKMINSLTDDQSVKAILKKIQKK